jgi:hypothetical protein
MYNLIRNITFQQSKVLNLLNGDDFFFNFNFFDSIPNSTIKK